MTLVFPRTEQNYMSSLAITQSFCRLMLINSLVAIPSYLGLFMIAVPFDVNVGIKRGLFITSPVFVFVLAAMIYAIAFLVAPPDNYEDHMYMGEHYQRLQKKIIRQKMKYILCGSLVFVMGIIAGTVLLVKAHV